MKECICVSLLQECSSSILYDHICNFAWGFVVTFLCSELNVRQNSPKKADSIFHNIYVVGPYRLISKANKVYCDRKHKGAGEGPWCSWRQYVTAGLLRLFGYPFLKKDQLWYFVLLITDSLPQLLFFLSSKWITVFFPGVRSTFSLGWRVLPQCIRKEPFLSMLITSYLRLWLE